jgi:hypothetical protein
MSEPEAPKFIRKQQHSLLCMRLHPCLGIARGATAILHKNVHLHSGLKAKVKSWLAQNHDSHKTNEKQSKEKPYFQFAQKAMQLRPHIIRT